MSKVVKPLTLLVCLVGDGIAVGFLSLVAGSALLAGTRSGWGALVGAIAGMVIGYPLGMIIVLALARFILKYRGSFLLALSAVIVGSALVAGLAETLNLNDGSFIGIYFGLLPLSAIAAYHVGYLQWRRRADSNR